MRSHIIGTGQYLPERLVSTSELAEVVGGDAEVMRRSSGIDTRHFAADHEAASDLALHASRRALDAAGCVAEEIDCVIFATHTPDYYFPGSGCVLAAKLGLVGTPALDVRNQCSGFLYGLSVADHFIRLGTYRRVLLVAAEVMSAGLEFSPRGREAAILFGDGAGAAVLAPEADDTRGVLGVGLHADGRYARSLMVEMPGSSRRGPLNAAHLEAGLHLPVVGGLEVVAEGYRHLREAVEEALATCRLTPDDVALWIPNQGAAHISRLLCRRLGVPSERVYLNLEQHGNATSASLPVCLDEVVRARGIDRGGIALLFSFGSGFTWAWAVIRW